MLLINDLKLAFDKYELIKLLLPERWQEKCQIDYNSTKNIYSIKYVPKEGPTLYLRYSKGPYQTFFWDVFPDDFITLEIAIIALSKAQVPSSQVIR